MEAAGPPPDRPSAPAVPPEDERPATVGDVRAVRRWVAVAGIWAVAATAVAVIALLDDNSDDQRKLTGTLAGEVARVQRHLDRRIDALEKRIDALPTSGDVKKLERRVAKAEDGVSSTRDDLKKLDTKLKDLDTRVDKLESSSSGTGGESTTPGGNSGSP